MKTEITDFNLHGIVGIRVIGATPGDLKALKKQLGPIQKPLSTSPDIVIRFVDQIPFSSPVRYLGLEDAGFTHDAFLVFRGKYRAHVKVQIPFQQIGSDQCEIICESGVPAVPLLIPIINLTALSKGILPLHASALTYKGKGILVTGWAKGGKTETLLAYAENGAEYIGDEWIYISQDGQCMFGIPEPIRIWYWHLQEMPQYKAKVKKTDLFRLQVLNVLVKFLEWVEKWGGSKLSRFLRRLVALVKQQLYVQVPPEKLFERMANGLTGNPKKIFFVGSHAEHTLNVKQVDPKEVAARMVFSLQEERQEFMSYYMKYRFAFPERSNPLLDQVEEIQRSLLLKVLAGKDTYSVYHPYPVSIPALFEVTHLYCV